MNKKDAIKAVKADLAEAFKWTDKPLKIWVIRHKHYRDTHYHHIYIKSNQSMIYTDDIKNLRGLQSTESDNGFLNFSYVFTEL